MAREPQPSGDGGASFVFTEFGGMDASIARQCIDDHDFSWLENVIPVGDGNLPVVYGNTPLTAAPSGTIVSLFQVNIAGVAYIIMQTLVSGTYNLYAVQISNGTITTIETGLTISYFASWNNQYLLYVNSANYKRWDPSGGVVSISASVVGGPIGVWGGRVFIAGGTGTRTLSFTAPNSVSDFTVADAGGNVVITDSALQGAITSMVTAGDWLYVMGPGYIGALSEIQVLNSAPPVTLFNVTRVSGVSGLTNTYAAGEYDGTLLVVNGHGVTQYQGQTRNPFSTKMDDFIADCDFTKNLGVAVTTIYNKVCLLALVYYNPTSQYYLMAYTERGWFLLNVGTTVVAVTWADQNSAPQAYYSDGNSVFALANNASGLVTGKISTKLYNGGNPVVVKQCLNFGMEIDFNSLDGAMSYTLDCLDGDKGLMQVPYDVEDISKNYSLGYQWVRESPANFGTYFGVTVTFRQVQLTFESFGMKVSYGNEWP